ncbi:hypothetical protein ACX12E_12175 [Paenibacillus vandeheii]
MSEELYYMWSAALVGRGSSLALICDEFSIQTQSKPSACLALGFLLRTRGASTVFPWITLKLAVALTLTLSLANPLKPQENTQVCPFLKVTIQ